MHIHTTKLSDGLHAANAGSAVIRTAQRSHKEEIIQHILPNMPDIRYLSFMPSLCSHLMIWSQSFQPSRLALCF